MVGLARSSNGQGGDVDSEPNGQVSALKFFSDEIVAVGCTSVAVKGI